MQIGWDKVDHFSRFGRRSAVEMRRGKLGYRWHRHYVKLHPS